MCDQRLCGIIVTLSRQPGITTTGNPERPEHPAKVAGSKVMEEMGELLGTRPASSHAPTLAS